MSLGLGIVKKEIKCDKLDAVNAVINRTNDAKDDFKKDMDEYLKGLDQDTSFIGKLKKLSQGIDVGEQPFEAELKT